MANAEMHAIQVHDTPVLLQAALTPGLKLVGEALVETTDGAGTGSDSHEGFGDLSHLVRAHPSHEHLRQSFGDMRFIATVAFKGLGMELTFPISGHVDLLEPTRRGRQIARVGAIAIAFAFGATLSPTDSDEGIEFLAHHQFQDRAHGALSQGSQMLMKFLLLWQWGRWFRR